MEFQEFTITKMKLEDIDEIVSMETNPSILWSKNMFIEELKNPHSYCFIFKKNSDFDQKIIGFICFRNIGEESEILNIYVHPKYRQLGIGKKIMQFYINFCQAQNIKKLYLEVNTSNQPAIHLYKLFSFKSVGIRKKFYQGKFDAYQMLKEL
jgi:ribosomal-protein-alanine N-acetyltransferase